jgi:hypothetical protein
MKLVQKKGSKEQARERQHDPCSIQLTASLGRITSKTSGLPLFELMRFRPVFSWSSGYFLLADRAKGR